MFLSLNSEEHTTQASRDHIVSEGLGFSPSHIWNRPSNTRRENAEAAKTDSNEEYHRSCLEERDAAIKINREEPNGQTFAPECTPNGNYKKTQCYNNLCWCVEENTGKSIYATASFNKSVNCDMKPDREMKENNGNPVHLLGEIIYLKTFQKDDSGDVVQLGNNNLRPSNKCFLNFLELSISQLK
eukprot:XP_014774586.1 PREDICTED: SPARC-related modular calcium-binding protein 1-like [Octopus bimaculoides]